VVGTVPFVAPSTIPVLLGGRYRLGALLGSGGMADVYDARDERLDRPVAVKVLRASMAAREDVRRRFEAEARAAARLHHPNIVAVYDSGEDLTNGGSEGVPYLVMERLPGTTLADRLAAGAGRDTEWVLRTAGDVLLALGAAHAAGLVHRDVKPGNVLIAEDGCAKVADFGIAKSLEVAAGAEVTATNQIIGTPAYLAPERILGQPATPQADLYAVGVVLYEALAGRKPFIGKTAVATADAIRHDRPPALASVRPDLPPTVVAAVERGMARDPTARFESAAAFARALGVGEPEVMSTTAASTVAVMTDDDPTIAVADAPPTTVLPAAVPVSALVPGAADGVSSRPPITVDRRRLAVVAIAVAVIALLAGAAAAVTGEDAPPPVEPTPTTVAVTAAPTTAPPTTAAAPVASGRERKGKKHDRDD
jgi:serine/threonine-protein kinase